MEKTTSEVTALSSSACLSAEVARLRTCIKETSTRLAEQADRLMRRPSGDVVIERLLDRMKVEGTVLALEAKHLLKFLAE